MTVCLVVTFAIKFLGTFFINVISDFYNNLTILREVLNLLMSLTRYLNTYFIFQLIKLYL